jgi:DMSO/TMAO reductase YedYZ molybdopterin-dependent catalytic subunit
MQCSGNGRAFHRPRAPGVQWERGAVGNAKWTGVRLRDVLTRAGVQASTRHLQMLGVDRPVVATTPLFLRSIPIEKALHPDTLLATHMNGEPLPLLHGAPVRLIAPGWMADACIKWLTDLTLQAEEAKGYYMETAYRHPLHPVEPGTAVSPRDMKPVEAMVVKSLIVSPASGTVVKQGLLMIEGVAWTGEGKVNIVEVSVDDGQKWEKAKLVGEDVPYAWRQWQFIWQPQQTGTRTILSRATDDHGQTQPMTSPWNPGGFLWNGVDRVQVEVKPA